MIIDAVDRKRLIGAVAEAVISHAEELSALDRAIGDGDHGLNMKRGFEAVLADLDGLAEKPLPDMLKGVGTHLVMTVGGASGPLYGTLFLALGKALPPAPTLTDANEALAQAVAAVMARGKSAPGQKTLIDVLVPVQDALRLGGDGLLARLKEAAARAAEATIPMRAVRGRASFLGDRSIGHLDPGARSLSLIVSAICDSIGAV